MNKFTQGAMAVLLVAATAFSNHVNTGGQKGIGRTLSAYSLGKQSIKTGASLKFDIAYRDIEVTNGTNTYDETAYLFSENFFFGYGLSNWADIAVDLPLYHDSWKNHDYQVGLGDLSISLKLMHPGMMPNSPFRIGYMLRTSLPTGREGEGYFQRHNYYTSEENSETSDAYTSSGVYLTPMLVWTWDLTKTKKGLPFLIHANLGATAFMWTGKEDNVTRDNSSLLGNIAVEYLHKENLKFFLDFSGESRLSYYADEVTVETFARNFNNDQVILSLGSEYQSPKGLSLAFAAEVGVSDDNNRTSWSFTEKGAPLTYSTSPTPTAGVNLTIGFNKMGKKADPDLDFIPSIDDSCPYEAEDYDQYEDEDGCLDKIHKADTITITETDTVLVIEKDTLTITKEAEKILSFAVITLRSINFTAGSDVLLKSSHKSLNDIATALKKHPEVNIEIRGYTDNTGNANVNKQLSLKRAMAVGIYLVDQGVAKKRLKPVGMGEADPIANNDTPEGRVLNRRVELLRLK